MPPPTPEARARAIGLAQEAVRAGEQLFRLGSYAQAKERFRAALEALAAVGIESPAALHRSLARCYDQLGQAPQALAAYRRFLARARPTSPAMAEAIRRATDAEGRLQRLLDRTALRFDVAPGGATVWVDGAPVPMSALQQPLRVSPGSHAVRVAAPGYEDQTVELNIEAGASAPVVVSLLPLPTPAPATGDPAQRTPLAATPPSQGARWGAATAGVVAVAALGGSVGVWLRSRSLDEEGDGLVGQRFSSLQAAEEGRAAAQERYDAAASRRYAAVALAGTACVALATASYLWWWGPRQPPDSPGGERQATGLRAPTWGVVASADPRGGVFAAVTVRR